MDPVSGRLGGVGGGFGGASGRFNRPQLLGSGRRPNQAVGFFQRGNNQNSPKKGILGQQQSPSSLFKRGNGMSLEKIKAGDEE